MIRLKWKRICQIVVQLRGRLIIAGMLQFLQMGLSLLTVYFMQVMADYVVNEQKEQFLAFLWWMLGVVILEAGSFFMYQEIFMQCKTKFVGHLREQIARKQLSANVVTKQGKTGAEWVNIYQNYIEPLAETIPNYGMVAIYPIQIVCAIVYYARISPKLLAAALILIPVCSCLYQKLSIPVQEKQGLLWEQKGSIRNFIKDVMKGFHTMKSYQLEPIFLQQYEDKIEKQIGLENEIDRINMTLGRVFILLQYIPQLIIPLFGGYLAFRGEITMGQFLAFGSSVGLIVLPIEKLLEVLKTSKEIEPAGEEIERILNWEEEEGVDEVEKTKDVCLKQGESISGGQERTILEIKNLTFGYQQTKPVLENVNLKVSEGEHIILLGESGSGKSTLINLISGFYPVKQGEIFVDHLQVNPETISRVRERISYVPQQPYIFQGSVAENIAMGKAYSREEIEKAAKAAQADQFIKQLPEGYDTKIGNGILELSGGQMQRIGIARGILKKCDLFILDEPTRALDPQSEQQFVKELREILKNRTFLMITHRKAVMNKEDRVLALKGGRIVEA